MPKKKLEKGTPKALDKKVKAKGLKKLKWYCQMCGKQCGDQNGFKRHCESESHQRQLLLFAEDQNAYLKEFSKDFESNFMHIFKHTFGGKRTRANAVYNEYIRDRGHVHMNATIWHTLGGFVRYLGDSGKCRIDENEKGWHIQYIDKEEEMRKAKLVDRAKQEKSDDDRMAELLQRQIERDLEKSGVADPSNDEPREFVRESEEQKIKFEFAPVKFNKEINMLPKIEPSTSSQVDVKPSKSDLDRQMDIKPTIKRDSKSSGRKRTALDELREEEERFKERKNRKDYWLHKGIIVKVVSKKADDKFYKAKGEVTNVIDKYTAEVTLSTGESAKFNQNSLETVIPAVGREMLVVNGAYRGEIVELEQIVEEKFKLKLRICEGTRNGRILELPYEDVSKLA